MRDEFGDSNIIDVHVDEDVDYEGDDIYRVTIVFNSKTGSLDPKKMSGLVRHIGSELKENMYRFPVLSFVSKAEAGKLGIATA